MRTRTTKKNRINVVTLGCSKNIFDSEVLMGQLKASKFDVSHESTDDEASVVIINTCGFIDNAKQESIDTILEYARAKEDGKINRLIVTGCLSERYKPDLRKEIPQVDEFFGTRDLPRLLKSLGADYRHELVGERLLTTPQHYAYLKISEGCDRPCSFCAIPLMRGKHSSVPVERLVQHAEKLAASGTKELILIAQDLTFYGLDIYRMRELSTLLKHLAAVDGIEWIRLHYAFPSGFPMDVLDVMNEHKKICRYIDMPLQHISDRILKSMKRGITRDQTIRLVDRIREKVPGITFRTTLIAGYPGETEQEFLELKEWVSNSRFDRLGIFAYSHEENTHAYSLEDNIPAALKKTRMEEIMKVQQGISEELNRNKTGTVCRILVDRKDGNYYVGRSEADSPEVDNEILIPAENHYFRIGDFAQVKITGYSEFDLYAAPVESL